MFQTETLFDVFFNDANQFYITTNTNSLPEIAGVKNGTGYVYNLSNLNINSAQKILKNTTSQSVVLTNLTVNQIKQKLHLKVVETNSVSGVVELVGYSNKLSNFIYVNGKKVNVQIACKPDCIVVGYPLILQGF